LLCSFWFFANCIIDVFGIFVERFGFGRTMIFFENVLGRNMIFFENVLFFLELVFWLLYNTVQKNLICLFFPMLYSQMIEYHVVFRSGTCIFWGEPNPNHIGDRVGPPRTHVPEEVPEAAKTPNYNTVMGFFRKVLVSKKLPIKLPFCFTSIFQKTLFSVFVSQWIQKMMKICF
jgi:hypothetical protein